jgi:hypothetical protein
MGGIKMSKKYDAAEEYYQCPYCGVKSKEPRLCCTENDMELISKQQEEEDKKRDPLA